MLIIFVVEFFDICEGSTEFHFDSLQDQLEVIKSDLKVAVENRKYKGPVSNFLSPELQVNKLNTYLKLMYCILLIKYKLFV